VANVPSGPSMDSIPHYAKKKIKSRPQGHSAAGRIRSIGNSSDLIGNRTRDLPVCSIMPQPTTLSRVALETQ
jgi:hypothetical protein